MPQMSYFGLAIAQLGGEVVRLDTSNADGTPRTQTLVFSQKHDVVDFLPDLGTGSTKTLWVADGTATVTAPRAIIVSLDPENAFEDDLERTAFTSGYAPVATVELTVADDTSGTNPEIINFELYREVPLVIPSGKNRTAITTATQDKRPYKVRARSNMASGYGNVRVRCLVLG